MRFLFKFLCLMLPWCALAQESFHAGPIFDELELTLDSGHRIEAAGPLFFEEWEGPRFSWGIPPLFWVTASPETESKELRVLYPGMSSIRFGGQYRWQLGQLISFAGGPSQGETNRHRVTLFPLFFSQRSSDPSQDYTAYGPFYGHLQNRLFRDEIFYVMFPGYSRTRKGQVITDNYLYPVFHLRHGPSLSGWQFWPLAGHEHKGTTTSTNGFQEVESVPGHDKSFILWPLYLNQHLAIGSDNPEHELALLPAYSLFRSPQRDSTTVLWPFFSRVDDREKKYREWDLPWPLVVFARGAGKHTSRVWPFYSHAYDSNLVSDFYLWPVYKHNRTQAEPLDRVHNRVLFFLYSDMTARNTEKAACRRRTDLWPLFTWRRDFNGNTRFQALALLESFLAENPTIENEYAPIYSLWRSERNPKTGATSQSLLWNLYRRQTTPNFRLISAFFGLCQTETSPAGTRLRLCYVPISTKRP